MHGLYCQPAESLTRCVAALQDQSGIFTSLVNNTGANAARKLRNIASRSYENVADALVDVERNPVQPVKFPHALPRAAPAAIELQPVAERSLEAPLPTEPPLVPRSVDQTPDEMWQTADSDGIITPRVEGAGTLSPVAQHRAGGGGSRFSAGGGSSRLSGAGGGGTRLSASRFVAGDSILSLPRSPRRSLGSGPLPVPAEYSAPRRERSNSSHRMSADMVGPEVIMFENIAANMTLPNDIESPSDSPAVARRHAYQPTLAKQL